MKNSSIEEETEPVKASEEKEVEDKIEKECKHCGNHSCCVKELEPMPNSILQTYGEWKSHKQIRFHMYSDAVKHTFGTGLGKEVKKKLPVSVTHIIREMCPDNEYTGFIPSPQDK